MVEGGKWGRWVGGGGAQEGSRREGVEGIGFRGRGGIGVEEAGKWGDRGVGRGRNGGGKEGGREGEAGRWEGGREGGREGVKSWREGGGPGRGLVERGLAQCYSTTAHEKHLASAPKSAPLQQDKEKCKGLIFGYEQC